MSIWIDRSVEYGDIKRLRQTFRVHEEEQRNKERLIDEDGNVIEDAGEDGLVIERFTSAEALDRLFSCNGEPLLSLAIESNQLKSLEVLLEIHLKYAITLDLKNKKTGQTALHAIAAKVPVTKSNTHIRAENNNNDEQNTTTHTQQSGRGRGRGRGGLSHSKSSTTPSAVRETTPQLVKTILLMLLNAGAFPSPKDNKGRTPLHIAMEMKNVDVIRILIENGACVTIMDKQNRKPLDYFLLFANGLKIQKEESVLQSEHEEVKQLVDKARCVIQTKKTRNNVVKEKNNTKNIFYAITKCDFSATKKFLDKGALVNGVSSRGLSPIYLACKHGYKDILELLISYGGNLKINNVRSTTPLHAACEHQHAHIVQYILDKLHTVEATDNDNIDNNTSIECTMMHVRDSDNKQPIDIAMKHNNTEIIDMLLPLHMKYEQYYGIGNLDNPRWNWYLREAAKTGNMNIVSRLLDAKCVNVNRATRGGWTPLHISVRFGHVDITRLLLEHGANPNAMTDLTQWTPLHIACELENEDTKCEIIEMLLHHGANPNSSTSTSQTALHMLVRKGQLRPVELLAKAEDLNVGVSDYKGWSPVDIALKTKHLEIMGFLLACGATIDDFPLFNACRGANNELVAQMLKYEDVDINFLDGKQWSVLGISVLKGISAEVISLILDHPDLDVNYVNPKGYSALHTAVSMNRPDVVELLCSKGKADVNIANHHSRVPLHTAILLNNSDIVETLLVHGADANTPYPSGNVPLQAALMAFHARNNSKKTDEATLKVAGAIVVEPVAPRGRRGAPARGRGGMRGREEMPRRGALRGRGAVRGRGRGGRGGFVGTPEPAVPMPQVPIVLEAPLYRPTLSMDPEAKRHNSRIIQLLVQYGADINSSITGFTMLHSAVHLLEHDLVKAILEHGGDPSFPSKDGIVPLVSLAMMLKGTDRDSHKVPKILAILRELLSHGAEPDATNAAVGRTPLMYAVDNNCFDFAKILLEESNPDVNIKEKNNWTALQIAVDKKSFAFTKLLIEHGADPTHSTNGWTPLHMAILKNQKDIIHYLVEECNVDINIETRIGTPLSVATKKNQIDGMMYLLEKGSKTTNLLDAKQSLWTILHESAKEGNFQIIQMLMGVGVPLDCQDPHGWTSLSRSRIDIVRHLLQNGADATIATSAGWQPLHTAVKTLPGKKHYGDTKKLDKVQKFDEHSVSEPCYQVIKYLLPRLSDLNGKLPSGSTPLDLAIACNNGVACSMLLEKRDANNNPIADFPDTKTKFDENWSILHFAAVRNLYNLIVPFAAFFDVNQTDKRNCTPAIIAAKMGHHHVIDALVQCGADLTVEDDEGKTALFWATKIRRKKAVKSLAHATPSAAYQPDDEGNRPVDIASQKPKRGNISTLLKNIVDKSYQKKTPQVENAWIKNRKVKDGFHNDIVSDLHEFKTTRYSAYEQEEDETQMEMPSDYDHEHLWVEPDPLQEEIETAIMEEYY